MCVCQNHGWKIGKINLQISQTEFISGHIIQINSYKQCLNYIRMTHVENEDDETREREIKKRNDWHPNGLTHTFNLNLMNSSISLPLWCYFKCSFTKSSLLFLFLTIFTWIFFSFLKKICNFSLRFNWGWFWSFQWEL